MLTNRGRERERGGRGVTTTLNIPSWYECHAMPRVCNHTCQTCDGMHVIHRFQLLPFDIFNEHSTLWLNGGKQRRTKSTTKTHDESEQQLMRSISAIFERVNFLSALWNSGFQVFIPSCFVQILILFFFFTSAKGSKNVVCFPPPVITSKLENCLSDQNVQCTSLFCALFCTIIQPKCARIFILFRPFVLSFFAMKEQYTSWWSWRHPLANSNKLFNNCYNWSVHIHILHKWSTNTSPTFLLPEMCAKAEQPECI